MVFKTISAALAASVFFITPIDVNAGDGLFGHS
jgi:hypothetical protein